MKDLRKWYKLNNREHNNNYTFGEVIFIALIFGLVVGVGTGFIVYSVTKKTVFDNNLNDIVNSYNEIVDTYYEDVNKEELADSAVDGMLNYLGEKYSKLLSSDAADSLTNSLTDTYTGIGIQVYNNGSNYVVYDVVKGSVAEEANIKSNDIITEINGKSVDSSMEVDDLTSLLSEDDTVNLKVKRDGKELTFKLSVGTVTIPVVSSKIINNDDNSKSIGYIYLESFTKKSNEQFENALKDLEDDGIDSLIIDLRDNTGGYLDAAKNIASLFLKKGKVIYSLEDKNDKTITYDETSEYRNYDVVVLLNEFSASASEILALALKESYGATIIGNTSYGKGKVQVTSTLSDDTMIKYTTAKWYSPNGNNIDEIGITPGIKVSQNIAFILKQDGATDSQLDRAVKFLIEK